MTFKLIKNNINLIAILIVTLLSLVLYIYGMSNLPENEIIKNISLTIFATGLTMSIFEFLYKSRGDKYFEEIINERIPIYLKLKDKGIEDITNSFNIEKYRDQIIKDKNLTIIMNDGKSFIGKYSNVLKRRLEEKGTTNFVILDPSSEVIPILNKKNGKTSEDYYQEKLLDVMREILFDFAPSKKHTVNLYIHTLFNTMSVVISDSIAMISLYRLSPGKAIVPHIEFKPTTTCDSEYTLIKDDVRNLIKNSKIITKDSYEEFHTMVKAQIKKKKTDV